VTRTPDSSLDVSTPYGACARWPCSRCPSPGWTRRPRSAPWHPRRVCPDLRYLATASRFIPFGWCHCKLS